MSDIDLIVNCYERTYREVLQPGYFLGIEKQNQQRFSGRIAVINNVDDRGSADSAAMALLASGEITSYVFVADRIDEALKRVGLSRRTLGQRPYFLDFALVMAITGESPLVLGWDAEVRLQYVADWVTAGSSLLHRRPDVFSVSPRWPARAFDTLNQETLDRDGIWHLSWGFSDQIWLVRRHEIAQRIYRRFAPAALARHSEHPRTFEARIEAYQRAEKRYRAIHDSIGYVHNDMESVLTRLGLTRREAEVTRWLNGSRRLLERGAWQKPRLRLP